MGTYPDKALSVMLIVVLSVCLTACLPELTALPARPSVQASLQWELTRIRRWVYCAVLR